ncbi:MAG: phosphoribosylamine--glycine ligase, partial [Deltaproteobacteria bacterium]|nr:phosphoribosylamine--glycine ligase [Deltaproteobacteria bacterium]
DALAAITDSLVNQKFGTAGQRIVIEEFLQGVEASFIAIVDGKNIVPLATARDYKPLLDGNKGPNTGGMGTYSPSPLLDEPMQKKVMEKIMQPAVAGMAKRGSPFVGFLYAGLMIHNGEPKLLEFNVRLGDPETQVILTRLKTDLVDIIEAALTGRLGGDDGSIEWDERATACIVLASKGYPESSSSGQSITGLENFNENQAIQVFHAGTALKAGKVVTAGGRVLGVTSWGKNVDEAARNAYSALHQISFEGMQYRKDIGK